MGGTCAKLDEFGDRELQLVYYIVTTCAITSHIAYLSDRKNPQSVPFAILDIRSWRLEVWTEGWSTRSPEMFFHSFLILVRELFTYMLA